RSELEHALDGVSGGALVAGNGYALRMSGQLEWEITSEGAGSEIWYANQNSTADMREDSISSGIDGLVKVTNPENPLLDWNWKDEIMEIMKDYARTTNGAFCWEAPSAVSFNFALSDPEWGILAAESLFQ